MKSFKTVNGYYVYVFISYTSVHAHTYEYDLRFFSFFIPTYVFDFSIIRLEQYVVMAIWSFMSQMLQKLQHRQ